MVQSAAASKRSCVNIKYFPYKILGRKKKITQKIIQASVKMTEKQKNALEKRDLLLKNDDDDDDK